MSTIKVSNLQNASAASPALVLNTDGTCSQLGVRNAIINGNPIINQRGYVSGTATSGANQYTLDRWRVVTSGQSITFTDSGNVRTVTAPAGGLEQVIEGINLITGTYTLNWTGTATATVAGNAVAKGGNVSITGGTDTTLRFSSGTFSLVQFEPGTVATPFERRSFGQELALCQRYYEKGYAQSVVPGTTFNYTGTPFASSNGGFSNYYAVILCFASEKRATPTIVSYAADGSSGNVSGDAGGTLVTATADASRVNTRGLSIRQNGGTTYYGIHFQWTATAEL